MEEAVGLWWHRAVTRWAEPGHATARVTLAEVRRSIEMLFRAGGGSPALRLAEAGTSRSGGARSWLHKLAGSGLRADLARLDPEALALPAQLQVFDTVALNRQLYRWLAALAAVHQDHGDWVADNLQATQAALEVFPGLAAEHAALLRAHLAQRRIDGKPAEAAVHHALLHGRTPVQAVQPHEVAPVWLWLLPGLPTAPQGARNTPSTARADTRQATTASTRRLRAERISEHRDRAAFILPFRAEALLSWSELVRVDRASDDSDNDDAAAAAQDLDHLSIAPDGQASASRVRFDLDLPSAAADDLPLGPGLVLPEWDWRLGRHRPAHCSVQTRVARPGVAFVPGPALGSTARRMRRRLETLRAAPHWAHAQRDGDEIDLDAWVRSRSAWQAGGVADSSPAIYHRRERGERQLATLLLADLSLSTETHVDNDQRVIDVVRDALYVFGEALAACGDAFEMLGFSSVRRQHVRLQHLKGFDEPWDERVRARLAAIKPGYYTRMGAALRAATLRLATRPERQRLLLLLTDGKPNDLDLYEGRYGLEDTRQAVREARAAGLLPFAVTIDEQAAGYLPQLFGQGGFAVVRRPRELVSRLAQVYAQLTRQALGS